MGIVFNFFILFGALFALVIASGQILLKNRQRHNIVLALLLVSMALWLGATGMYPLIIRNGYKFWQTVVALAIAAPLYCTGPLVYFYFQFLIDEDYSLKKNHLIYIIPFLSAVTIILLTDGAGTYYLLIVSIVYCALFLMAVIKQVLQIIRNADEKRKSIIVTVLIICIYLVGLAVLRIITDSAAVPSIGITIFLIAIYLLSLRNPEFLMVIKIEAEKIKYAQSQLKNINIDDLMRNLNDVMTVDKIFTDENLSLQMLASELSVSKHQLSELLNVKFNMTFNNYINRFRIDEAKKLLIDDLENSILSIAYAVGFNSTSAFYSAFQKQTGQSPTAYRQTSQ